MTLTMGVSSARDVLRLRVAAGLELQRRRRVRRLDATHLGGAFLTDIRQDSVHLDLLTWTMVRRVNLGPGKAFDLTRHRFLGQLYRERAQRVVLMKAGQMGGSEWAISYALHACDERGATALYVFPTDKHVSDFSAARIGPAIEASDYLDRIVIEGGAKGGKRGADRVLLKRVRDRFIYFRGAKVDPDGNAPQLKSVDADVLILDEVDEMDPRAPSIAVKRLGHSLLKEERWLSTPTYVGVGVHALWKESDQRQWHVKCDACGEWQPLTIQQVVTAWDSLERPVAWNGMEDNTAWMACRKCGGLVDRLGPGAWVSAYSEREMVGYHVTKLFSPIADLGEIVRSLITTDETKRKECYNQDLGLPYVPRGGQLTDEVLDACRREYGHGPAPREQTVMGVDVGKVLHGVIRSKPDPETRERRQRWAGEIESFDGVKVLMQRFNVGALVIDALPETTKARELQAEFPPGQVWLAYYTSQSIGSKRAEPVQWDRKEGVVNLDRTRTLDDTLGRFFEGTNTLPANARALTDYYAHLKATVRVLEDGPGGQKVARYIASEDDHLAHAENYCTAAGEAKVHSLVVEFS